MGIRKRLKKGWQAFKGMDEETRQEWIQLADFLGIDTSNKTALSEATYFACITILSESIGKLPCKLLKKEKDGGIKSMREHPLYGVVNFRPNRFMTSTAFWSYIEQQRSHIGNAYALIEGAGSNLTLWPLNSDDVTIWYDDKCVLSDVPDVFYIWSYGGKQYRLTSEQVLHFRSSHSNDGIKGISVIDYLGSSIRGNQKSQELMNKLYENGMTSKLVVQYTGSLSDELANEFAEGIEKYARGTFENVKTVIPIPLGSSVTPLNMKLSDSQYLEIKQYTSLQIAAAFGIKPIQVNDYSKASYSSQEQQNIAFYVDALLYIMKHMEEELKYKLLSDKEIKEGYYFKFNIYALLRTDMKTQIESLSLGTSSFLYQPNEARAMLDLSAVPGGDKLLGNGASIPVELAGSQYANIQGGENNE